LGLPSGKLQLSAMTDLVASIDAPDGLDARLGVRELSKLRWRTRRGLLENDLFIARFFAKYEQLLTVRQANSLNALMDLSDNDLLDLHLSRKSLKDIRPEFDTPDIQNLLSLLQQR
jgi:antitoxin CptB